MIPEPSRTVAHLYKITHLPTGLLYWGSTWGDGKSIHKRFTSHLSGDKHGGKWIRHLIENGAVTEEFTVDLVLVGNPDYVCESERLLAKDNLWPKGLNGNAGKNIIRSPDGQKKVEAAVSKAKKGRTKENSEGVASQANKVSAQRGDRRTPKQKKWDAKKSALNKSNGNRPPSLPFGAKRMNNGVEERWVPPDQIGVKLIEGWTYGWIGKREAHNRGLKHMRRGEEKIRVRPEEVGIKLSEGWLLGNGPQKNPRKKK